LQMSQGALLITYMLSLLSVTSKLLEDLALPKLAWAQL